MRQFLCIFLMSLLSFLGLTGTARAEPTSFEAEYGMRLLGANKFDESAAYFEKHLEKSAIAHYGLALTKFRRDPAKLTVPDLRGIVRLFEEAIALAPEFADAYFMCAMAYNQAAGLQLGPYNKNPTRASREGLLEPDAYLEKAGQYFQKATTLNPGFSSIVAGEAGLTQRLQQLSSSIKAGL